MIKLQLPETSGILKMNRVDIYPGKILSGFIDIHFVLS